MIFDKLENLRQYDIVSDKILEFLFNIDENTPNGRYEIDETSYANIEEYNTKAPEICYFEAHQKYIDIQMLLKGEERLDFRSINGLTKKEEYNEERDIIFFNEQDSAGSIKLSDNYFALLLPHDAHRPQMNINNHSQSVKKVVVKVSVN